MGWTIRPALEGDLGAINAIYNYYVACSTCTYQTEPTADADRRAWLLERGGGRGGREEYPVTVAVDDAGRVVGWGALSPFHKRAAFRYTVENSVYVHPDHVRRGIGRGLLADLLERATVAPVRAVVAVISSDQTPSVALHRSLGFVECGGLAMVGYKFGRWLDVTYMEWLNAAFVLRE